MLCHCRASPCVAMLCHCHASPSSRCHAFAKPIFASRCYAIAVQRRAKPLPPRRTTNPSISFALPYAAKPCRRQAMLCRAFAERSISSQCLCNTKPRHALPLLCFHSSALPSHIWAMPSVAGAMPGRAFPCRCVARQPNAFAVSRESRR